MAVDNDRRGEKYSHVRDRWWTTAFMRRLRDAHIPPRFNQVAVRNGIRFEIVAEYDAQVPPAVSRVRCPGHHRESL